MFWPTGGIAHQIPPSQLIFIMNRGVSWPPPRSMVLQDGWNRPSGQFTILRGGLIERVWQLTS